MKADYSGNNHKIYSKDRIVKEYSRLGSLWPAEAMIFNQLRDWAKGKHILDIGVGAGRTIPHLSVWTPHYVGIDYSSEMIRRCRKAYPGVGLLVCDARDLSRFADESFDLVVFSFNGLDMVGHTDRLQVLREIYRVLHPGGYLVFSSHNKERSDRVNVAKYRFPSIREPGKWLDALLSFPLQSYRRAKNRRLEIHTDDYAILNDRAHDYQLMTYYIGIATQKKQLMETGFRGPILAYGKDGTEVEADEESSWVHYLAQKTQEKQGISIQDRQVK